MRDDVDNIRNQERRQTTAMFVCESVCVCARARARVCACVCVCARVCVCRIVSPNNTGSYINIGMIIIITMIMFVP